MHFVPVLTIKQKTLEIRGRGDSSTCRLLDSFLDTVTPLSSNYFYERRCGLFGMSSVFHDLRERSRSHSTLRQHIAVEGLIPQCEVGLSDADFLMFTMLCVE